MQIFDVWRCRQSLWIFVIATFLCVAAHEPSPASAQSVAAIDPAIATTGRRADAARDEPGDGAGVFGSVKVRIGRVAQSDRWSYVLEERADQFFHSECAEVQTCSSPVVQALKSELRAARGRPVRERAMIVNHAVNRLIRFRDDIVNYGETDHWALVKETLASGSGDCEDFAILKMWVLIAAGIPQEMLQLVLVQDVTRHVGHAVLLVQSDDEKLVLDSLSEQVDEKAFASRYRPLISMSSAGTWVHGFQRKIAPGALASNWPSKSLKRTQ